MESKRRRIDENAVLKSFECLACGNVVTFSSECDLLARMGSLEVRLGQGSVVMVQFPDYYPGQLIDDRWITEKALGSGGFGAVYLVKDKQNPGEDVKYALKTEFANQSRNLKQEVYVLVLATLHNRKHFCRYIHAGSTEKAGERCFYLVMTLIGDTLEKKHRMAGRMTLGCALSVGMQCLTAIEEIHSIGFLHRDVKPENFAVSKENEKLIIIFDFGLCRQYLDDKGRIRLPRPIVGFRGTVRYAPLSSHVRRDPSRKCDLETWFYQQVEFTKGCLPWRQTEKKDEIGMFKERCRFGVGLDIFLGGCPRQYIEILRYIDQLGYYDEPDYNKIHNLLRMVMKVHNVSETYDWLEKAKSAEKEKPQPANGGGLPPV
uniref:Protein kinase domain-containing protein n=1 Tax=Steinernema glaseri TaxID=37863 RepID=A0A1I8ACV1_9BILA